MQFIVCWIQTSRSQCHAIAMTKELQVYQEEPNDFNDLDGDIVNIDSSDELTHSDTIVQLAVL